MESIRNGSHDWSIGLIHARKRASAWWGEAKNTDELFKPVVAFGRELGVTVTPFVSEYEPEIVDFIYAGQDAFLVNPATFTLYGEAMRSALIAVGKPFVELHALNLSKWLDERSSRQNLESNFTHPAMGLVMGFGIYGYYGSLLSLVGVLDDPKFMG